ncbi:hypothetical protein [Chitinophaga sp. RAB17]|uniref:hypothetical protein n=1 Tax=Chitinophaga sp. RAB17 TaxID=3233049 RepID=UPI003F903280
MRKSLRNVARVMLIGGVGLVATQANAQLKVGKNPTSIQKSAILELESDKQGLLLPRIADTTLMTSLNPPDGMIIYWTASGNEGFYVRHNNKWERMATKASSWDILGNALTNAATQFIGSTNNFPFIMKANNKEGIRIDDGNVTLSNKVTLSGIAPDATNTLVDAVIVDGTGLVSKRTLTKAAFSNFMINASAELNHVVNTDNGTDYKFTDVNVAGTSSTHTLSIATQDGTKGVGLLTKADWKTFSDAAAKSLQVAAFSNTSNANGLTIDNTGTNPTIALNAADATHPGGVSTGLQTFGGDKTFAGKITGSNGLVITTGGANITGVTNITGNTNVTGDADVTGTFHVLNTTKLDNTLTITTGGANITGATKVTGPLEVTGIPKLGGVVPGGALDSTLLLLNSSNEVVSKKLPLSLFTEMTFTQNHAGTDLKVDKNSSTNVVTVSVPQADPSVIGGLVSNASQSFAGNKRFANDVAVKSTVIIGDTTNAANSTLQVAGSVSMSIKEVTGTAYTIDASDYTLIVKNTAAVTLTLPSAAGAKGRIYTIKKVAADATNNLNNAVTVKATAGQFIEDGNSVDIYNDWTFITVQSNGVDTWYIIKK